MKLFKRLFGKTEEEPSIPNVAIPNPDPVIERIVAQAVESLFLDINT